MPEEKTCVRCRVSKPSSDFGDNANRLIAAAMYLLERSATEALPVVGLTHRTQEV